MSTIQKLKGLHADIERLEKSDLLKSTVGGSVGISVSDGPRCQCGISADTNPDVINPDFGKLPQPNTDISCSDTPDPAYIDPIFGPAGRD